MALTIAETPRLTLSAGNSYDPAYEQWRTDNAVAGAGQIERGWTSAGLGEDANSLSAQANEAYRLGDTQRAMTLEQQAQDLQAQAQQWAPTVQNMTDVTGLRSGIDWAAGALGGVRTSVKPALGGLAGAAVGGIAGLATRNAGLGARVGGWLGGTLAGYGSEYDEAVAGAMNDPTIRATRSYDDMHQAAQLKGVANSALEGIVPGMMGGSIVAGAGKKLARGELLKAAGKEVGKEMLTEGVTEGAQSLVGQATTNSLLGNNLTDFDYKQALNEAAAGAVAGGGMGVIGAAGQMAHAGMDTVGDGVGKAKDMALNPVETLTDAISNAGDKIGQKLAGMQADKKDKAVADAADAIDKMSDDEFLAHVKSQSNTEERFTAPIDKDSASLSDSELVAKHNDEAAETAKTVLKNPREYDEATVNAAADLLANKIRSSQFRSTLRESKKTKEKQAMLDEIESIVPESKKSAMRASSAKRAPLKHVDDAPSEMAPWFKAEHADARLKEDGLPGYGTLDKGEQLRKEAMSKGKTIETTQPGRVTDAGAVVGALSDLWRKREGKKYAHVFDETDHSRTLTLGLMEWIRSGYGAEHNDGKPMLPTKFIKALGEDAEPALASMADYLERQGQLSKKAVKMRPAVHAQIQKLAVSEKSDMSVLLKNLRIFSAVRDEDGNVVDHKAAHYVWTPKRLELLTQRLRKNNGVVSEKMRDALDDDFLNVSQILEHYTKDNKARYENLTKGFDGDSRATMASRTEPTFDSENLSMEQGVKQTARSAEDNVKVHGAGGKNVKELKAFDLSRPDGRTKLDALIAKNKDDMSAREVKEVGAHEYLKARFTGTQLMQKEDLLIQTKGRELAEGGEYGDLVARLYNDLDVSDLSNKQRDTVLGMIDRQFRYVEVEHADAGVDHREITDITKYRVEYKHNGESGVRRDPRLETVDQGFLYLRKKDGSEFPTRTSRFLTPIEFAKAKEDGAQNAGNDKDRGSLGLYKQVLWGLSNLIAAPSGNFTAEIGYREYPGAEITWMKDADSAMREFKLRSYATPWLESGRDAVVPALLPENMALGKNATMADANKRAVEELYAENTDERGEVKDREWEKEFEFKFAPKHEERVKAVEGFIAKIDKLRNKAIKDAEEAFFARWPKWTNANGKAKLAQDTWTAVNKEMWRIAFALDVVRVDESGQLTDPAIMLFNLLGNAIDLNRYYMGMRDGNEDRGDGFGGTIGGSSMELPDSVKQAINSLQKQRASLAILRKRKGGEDVEQAISTIDATVQYLKSTAANTAPVKETELKDGTIVIEHGDPSIAAKQRRASQKKDETDAVDSKADEMVRGSIRAEDGFRAGDSEEDGYTYGGKAGSTNSKGGRIEGPRVKGVGYGMRTTVRNAIVEDPQGRRSVIPELKGEDLFHTNLRVIDGMLSQQRDLDADGNEIGTRLDWERIANNLARNPKAMERVEARLAAWKEKNKRYIQSFDLHPFEPMKIAPKELSTAMPRQGETQRVVGKLDTGAQPTKNAERDVDALTDEQRLAIDELESAQQWAAGLLANGGVEKLLAGIERVAQMADVDAAVRKEKLEKIELALFGKKRNSSRDTYKLIDKASGAVEKTGVEVEPVPQTQPGLVHMSAEALANAIGGNMTRFGKGKAVRNLIQAPVRTNRRYDNAGVNPNLKAIKSKITALIGEIDDANTQNADGRAEARTEGRGGSASTQAATGVGGAVRGNASTESKANTGGQPTAAANTRTETEVTFNVGKDFKQFKFAKYVDPKKPRAAPVRRDPNEPKMPVLRNPLTLIKKHGGISTAEALDLTGESAFVANMRAPGLFSKNGIEADAMREVLHDGGWINDSIEEARALIDSVYRGEEVIHPNDVAELKDWEEAMKHYVAEKEAGELDLESKQSTQRAEDYVEKTPPNKPAVIGSSERPHNLPMSYKVWSLDALRPELRSRYKAGVGIAELIARGDRTATTRTVPNGVAVGHFVTFPKVDGLYQITSIAKIDLKTPEGVEAWSKKEGWSVEMADRFGSQVRHGATQITFKRVDAKQSTQRAEGGDQAQRAKDVAAAEALLLKTVGPKIEVAFVESFPDGSSGLWTKGQHQNVITLALNGDVLGTAFHESIHELFDMLKTHGGDKVGDLLKRVASNPMLNRKIEQALNGHPEAQKQVRDNPEEAVAFLYQLHILGLVKLGPEARSAFDTVKDFLRKVASLFSDTVRQAMRKEEAERMDADLAEAVLAKFFAGKLSDTNTRQAVIDAMVKDANTVEKITTNIGKTFDGVWSGAGKYAFSTEAIMDLTNNKHLIGISRRFNQKAGAAMGKYANGAVGSFYDGVRAETDVRMNQLVKLLGNYDEKDLELARQGKSTGVRPTDRVAAEIFDKITKFFSGMATYINDSDIRRLEMDEQGHPKWVEIEFRPEYWPRVFDIDTLTEKGNEFVADLLKHHDDKLQELVDAANKDAPAGQQVTKEDIAIEIMRNCMNTGTLDNAETESRLGFTPAASAVNRRTLTWLDAKAFDKYMSKDVVNIMSTYTRSIIKRGEYQKRFGYGGEKINDGVANARLFELGGEDLVTRAKHGLVVAKAAWSKDSGEPYPTIFSVGAELHREDVGNEAHAAALKEMEGKLAPAMKAIQAMEGTLGRDIAPMQRAVNSWLVTYQNVRLLSTMLFTSFSDVAGVVVNGGEMKDAWGTFVSGIKGVKDSWSKGADFNGMMARAEEWGAVDAGSSLDSIGQAWGSVYMTGAAKKISDKFFKYSGAEGWNRGIRSYAAGVAERTIMDWVTNGADMSNPIVRQRVERLFGKGFDVSTIVLDQDGNLDSSNAANRAAVNRWVLDAVPAPNAAHRTFWMSDPRFQAFSHLKNFTYTWHRTVLLNAINSAQLGDYRPITAVALGYMPIAIAAGAIKEMLIPGDEPPWMKGGLDGYLSYGFARAGVLGVPQMYASSLADPASILGPTFDQLQNIATIPLGEVRVNLSPFEGDSKLIDDHTFFGEGLGSLPMGNLLRRVAQ